MPDVVIRVENLSKHYRLGNIGGATLREDLQRWWANLRGRKDLPAPLEVGEKSTSTDHWALRDVSFEVRRGEVLGVVGRNGAGKSTLLKILSRTTAPTGGLAVVRGRIGSLLEVGTGFHPELTGRENVYLNGSLLGMRKSEIARRMDEIVGFSGIEKFLDTPVKRYSSGMYVRLAFSVAAHLESEILIVDEVLAVGDSEFQRRCIERMQTLARTEKTILFVSHQMSTVSRLTSRALILESGVVSFEGAPQQVIQAYIESLRQNIEGLPLSYGPLLVKLAMFDAEGVASDVYLAGQSIRFRILIVEGQLLDEVDFQVAIYSSDGQRITTLSSRLERSLRMCIATDTHIDVEWPRCNLSPGSYFVALGLWREARYVHSWDNVCRFRIEDADYFGNGLTYEPWMGPVLTRSNWSISHQPGSSQNEKRV